MVNLPYSDYGVHVATFNCGKEGKYDLVRLLSNYPVETPDRSLLLWGFSLGFEADLGLVVEPSDHGSKWSVEDTDIGMLMSENAPDPITALVRAGLFLDESQWDDWLDERTEPPCNQAVTVLVDSDPEAYMLIGLVSPYLWNDSDFLEWVES
jgi:hypothetical protein